MDNLDKLFSLFLDMIDENDSIDMRTEVQENVVNTLMAREMEPNKRVWEKLGFVFSSIPGDDDLYNAIMPEGWSMRGTDHSMWTDIIDENNMIRGSMFYKAAFYDRRACMNLSARYKVFEEKTDLSVIKVYFGNENEKIFCAGEVFIPENLSYEAKEEKYVEVNKLWHLAFDFANENYPDWKDVTAYWDITNDKEKNKVK